MKILAIKSIDNEITENIIYYSINELNSSYLILNNLNIEKEYDKLYFGLLPIILESEENNGR